MSIEIEVGLENATKAPRITEQDLKLEEEPKRLGNPKVRRLLVAGGAVALAASISTIARRPMMRKWTGISRRWLPRFTGEWRKFWLRTTRR
jgi:hypothetical protein